MANRGQFTAQDDHRNPFDDDEEDGNPFADLKDDRPMAQHAAPHGQSSHPHTGTDEITVAPGQTQPDTQTKMKNAFTGFTTAAGSAMSSAAASVQKGAKSVQSQFKGSQPLDENNLSDEAIRRKEEELERREKQLQEQEAALNYREDHLPVFRPNNWPMCVPILYHNILIDIPLEARGLTTRLYRTWIVLCIMLCFNFVAQLSVAFSPYTNSSYSVWQGVFAVVMVVLGPPGGWLIWYRPVYNGFKKDLNSRFVMFFLGFGLHTLLMIYYSAGFYSTGAVGVITCIDMFSNSKTVAGILCLIMTGAWILMFFWSVFHLQRVHSYYRGHGMSLEKAQSEAIVEVGSSSAGQKMARAAVKSQMGAK